METANFTWNTEPETREFDDKGRKVYFVRHGCKPKTNYKSSILKLKTTPNEIVLKLQMVIDYNPTDSSMVLGVINHHEEDLVVNFDIESNFFDESPADLENFYKFRYFERGKRTGSESSIDEIFAWVMSQRHETPVVKKQEPMMKKQFQKIKLPSKKNTILLDSDVFMIPPFVFNVTVTMEDQFSRALRSMRIVKKLLEEDAASDFTIICRPDEFTAGHGREERFSVHKAILGCRSDVFEAMMAHGMQEAKTNKLLLTDISIEALKEVIHFVYHDEIQNLENHAIELLSAGDKFLLFNMKRKAEKFLIDNLRLSTVLDVVAHAYLHNSETLLEIASMFIVKHFDCVMYEPKWPDFVREQPELLMQILKKIPLCYSYQVTENAEPVRT